MSEMKWYKSGRRCPTHWQELLGPYKYITAITFVKWTFYLEEDITEGSIYHRPGMRFGPDYYSMLYRGYSASMVDNFIRLTATMKTQMFQTEFVINITKRSPLYSITNFTTQFVHFLLSNNTHKNKKKTLF